MGIRRPSDARCRRIILALSDATCARYVHFRTNSRVGHANYASPAGSSGIPRSVTGRCENGTVGNNFWIPTTCVRRERDETQCKRKNRNGGKRWTRRERRPRSGISDSSSRRKKPRWRQRWRQQRRVVKLVGILRPLNKLEILLQRTLNVSYGGIYLVGERPSN